MARSLMANLPLRRADQSSSSELRMYPGSASFGDYEVRIQRPSLYVDGLESAGHHLFVR